MKTLNLTAASLSRSLRSVKESEIAQKAIDAAIWTGAFAVASAVAYATTTTGGTTVAGATEVTNISNWIKDMTTGSMGNVFALGTLAVGLATGIVRQTLMPVAVAVGMAATAKWGPGILLGITGTVI